MLYYAGIGSRETPKEFLDLFTKVAEYLSRKGCILRSGGANGSDKAFELGAINKEIYLPWKGFEGSNSNLVVQDGKAFDIAAKYHPRWNYLSDGARRLQARNSHQILGWDLNSHSDFVICWTKGGKGNGGTGQAIRIAKDYNIPVFDCGEYINAKECAIELKKFLDKILKEK